VKGSFWLAVIGERHLPANSGHLVSRKTGAIHFYYGWAGLAGWAKLRRRASI